MLLLTRQKTRPKRVFAKLSIKKPMPNYQSRNRKIYGQKPASKTERFFPPNQN